MNDDAKRPRLRERERTGTAASGFQRWIGSSAGGVRTLQEFFESCRTKLRPRSLSLFTSTPNIRANCPTFSPPELVCRVPKSPSALRLNRATSMSLRTIGHDASPSGLRLRATRDIAGRGGRRGFLFSPLFRPAAPPGLQRTRRAGSGGHSIVFVPRRARRSGLRNVR